MTGKRIPQEFRNKVNYRIRQVMKPYVREMGSLHAEAVVLSQSFDICPETVRLWHEGVTLPTLYNLVRFADYYDVSIDYLLGRTAVKELESHLKLIHSRRRVA